MISGIIRKTILICDVVSAPGCINNPWYVAVYTRSIPYRNSLFSVHFILRHKPGTKQRTFRVTDRNGIFPAVSIAVNTTIGAGTVSTDVNWLCTTTSGTLAFSRFQHEIPAGNQLDTVRINAPGRQNPGLPEFTFFTTGSNRNTVPSPG